MNTAQEQLQKSITESGALPPNYIDYERKWVELKGGTAVRKHQLGRNDLCICGSGKKVKFCCLDEVENKYLARDNKKK